MMHQKRGNHNTFNPNKEEWFQMQPYILTNVTDETSVMKEGTGYSAIVTYNQMDDAIAYVNKEDDHHCTILIINIVLEMFYRARSAVV